MVGNFVSLLRPQESDCVGKDFVGATLGRRETDVPFCLPKKEPKRHQGAASGEHHACGGAHSHCPLDPRYGSVSLWMVGKFRRPKF